VESSIILRSGLSCPRRGEAARHRIRHKTEQRGFLLVDKYISASIIGCFCDIMKVEDTI
jgi:hypothetical protein